MSESGRVFPVEIHGQRYPIRSSLEPEYVARLARYVDEKMKAAGVAYPIANGGTRPDDGQKFEAALAGISPAAYRTAIMNLDGKALKGPEVKAA